ncbi:hypothetical protein ASF88_16330 [Leifsonia sp. Leaf336]|uniref:hypothetical protein n=1 Tax=Leifsonia sp. Leaf336 TaxID=1736341 RepID=UPI0006F6239E|nr:hypothetical protein [Leifsonia sp. Leaf336]KQR50798.1 hypothetical protein ASF88_16330 [Leifsonia sp. Leaf336]
MSIFTQYFSAPSDADAAKLLEDGPEGVIPEANQVILFSILPVVEMDQLEAILSGVATDDSPTGGRMVAEQDGGRWVWGLNEGLRAHLTECSLDELVASADPWSEIDEFWGGMDPDVATHFLLELRVLASKATAANHNLYCWVCL